MIDLGLRTSKQVVSREHGSVYCEASVTPVGIETTRRRNPVALVLCLDRSGSMGESSGGHGRQSGRGYQTKMHHARSAAQQAVAQLLDGDSIGLVTFSAEARVDIPLTQVGPSTREAMLARIGMIGPEASTNLASGIVAAASQFVPTLRRELPCKIVVLSDGLANVGVADLHGLTGLAREYGQAGITISTIGVGDDYSAETMSAIAQAAGGEFYHVGDPGEIEAAVAAEVADIKTVAARQAELRVTVPPLVAIGGNLNLLPQEDVPGGVAISLGDVVRARQVIFEIATPVALPGQQVAISVECRYVDPITGQRLAVTRSVVLALVAPADFAQATSDSEVTSLVQELVQSRAVRMATAAYEHHDVAGASAVLQCAVDALGVTDQGFSEHSDHVAELRLLRESMARNQVSADEAKTLHSVAYARATSRPRKAPHKPKEG